jgi:sortase A
MSHASASLALAAQPTVEEKTQLTTLDTRSQVSGAAPASAPESSPAPAPPAARGPGRPALRGVLSAVLLLLVLVIGFFVYLYGLSSVSESRAQTTMFKPFVAQLQQALAPVGPAKEGAPVAVLNIPEIGLRDVVVVEGTTSRDLSRGPGHSRTSALPGQTGVSFIFGKVATFGGPFAHLMRLNRGDRFTVATGQGIATYKVDSFGTSTHPAPANSVNRLVLVTAGSSFMPGNAVQVSANLVSNPQPNPGGWPAPSAQETAMAWDTEDSLIPLVLWSQVLLIAVIAVTIAAHFWSRWPTYLIAAPVIITLTWCVYENLAGVLPNLY